MTLEEILNKLRALDKRATKGPWHQHYGYNNGGMATAFFSIPGHNRKAEVEMLVEDAELIVEMRNLLPELLRILTPASSEDGVKESPQTIEVWCEGYMATGDSAEARLLGKTRASTLKEACDKLYSNDPSYDPERMTYWGCRLFDNEDDARKSFG